MGFLAGKRILITGLLSNRSISYGIAKAMHREGAELAFTYQSERFQDRVTKLAAEFDSRLVYACDVQNDAEITSLFEQLGQQWDGLDALVHSIAFAPKPWKATSSKVLPGKPSASPRKSAPTVFPPWPRPHAR